MSISRNGRKAINNRWRDKLRDVYDGSRLTLITTSCVDINSACEDGARWREGWFEQRLKEYELKSSDIIMIADGEEYGGASWNYGQLTLKFQLKRRTLSLNVPILICTRYVAQLCATEFSQMRWPEQ